MNARRLMLPCLFIAGFLVQAEASAAIPFSTLCQTPRGICPAASAPVGASCRCGGDGGRMIPPPQTASNACGTPKGVCRVEYAPTGSPCVCGGRDSGQRIQLK